MAKNITQVFEEASIDAQALEKFVNATAEEMVVRRLAEPIRPLSHYKQYMDSLSQGKDATITSVTAKSGAAGTEASVSVGGTPNARTFEFTIPKGENAENIYQIRRSYQTYELMVADKANIPPNTSIDVTNDEDYSENGTYTYDGTSFTKSIHDTQEVLKKAVEDIKQDASDAFGEAILQQGFVTIDSFELGATLTQRNQALRHALDGKLYRWAGDLPKVVPVGSTPLSSGGISANAWLEVSDTALRSDVTFRGVGSVSELLQVLSPYDGMRVYVKSYHAGLNKGGGYFTYTSDKADVNDGGSVINGWVRGDVGSITSDMFGTFGDKIADDTTALEQYIAYLKKLKVANFILPSGEYRTTRPIVIDLPNYSSITFLGTIYSEVVHDTALTIGGSGKQNFSIKFSGISVRSTVAHEDNVATDTELKSVGVKLMNLLAGSGSVTCSTGFSVGVHVSSDFSNGGTSYCEVSLGYLKNNTHGVYLAAAEGTGGYTNENTFYGGAFGHGSTFPVNRPVVNLKVEQTNTHRPNNNLFFRPSLEAWHETTVAAEISGHSNNIYMPRMENGSDYGGFKIRLMPDSVNCCVSGGGFGLKRSSVIDEGSYNKVITEGHISFAGSARTDYDESIVDIKNFASNSGKSIRVLNIGGLETYSVLTSGEVSSNRSMYATSGFRWRTADSSNKDRGIFVGITDDSATARYGSMFVNTTTGEFYIKKGSKALSDTGWRAIQEVVSTLNPDSEETKHVGKMVFNTTLGKPVWWNGTDWVDSSGTVV